MSEGESSAPAAGVTPDDSFAGCSPEMRKARGAYIDSRWKGLAEQIVVRLDAAVNYLMLANAGGAIATLGFMGAMKTVRPIAEAPLMLGLLLVGIALVGVLRAIHYYRISWLFAAWRDDVNAHLTGKLGWKALLERDARRSNRFVLADLVGILAFGCFLYSIYIGYRGILETGVTL